jgi:hypothetical protein
MEINQKTFASQQFMKIAVDDNPSAPSINPDEPKLLQKLNRFLDLTDSKLTFIRQPRDAMPFSVIERIQYESYLESQ